MKKESAPIDKEFRDAIMAIPPAPNNSVNAKAWERESRQNWKTIAQTRMESLATVSSERDALSNRHSDLLSMVKMCYRKHVLGDENIGWNQLDDYLLHALCNDMGDEGFEKWAEAAKENL